MCTFTLPLTLLLFGFSWNVVAISEECEKFCNEKRPLQTTDGFMIMCVANDSHTLGENECPGECGKNNCDNIVCPDGKFVYCPSKSDLRYYPSEVDVHHEERRSPYYPSERPNKQQTHFNATILLIVIVVVIPVVLVVLCIGCGVYIYASFIKRRNEANLNRYQLQAPRPHSTQNPSAMYDPPSPSTRSPSRSQKVEKVSLSTHYMDSEGSGVQSISPAGGHSQNFDYTVQPL